MSHLIVFSASAGSGKTHKIVGKYISMLFRNIETPYKHILAVTFTNKAGEEMKTRIIKELNNIASGNKSDYINEIKIEYNLSEDEIRKRAKEIFKQILHDYSHFSVFTIDSFFQKILKSFTYETGIQYNYEVELDIDNVIDQVVDRMIVNSNEDQELKNNLIELINQNIAEGKRWDARLSLKSFLKEVYKSEYRTAENQYNDFFADKNKVYLFLTTINKIIASFENKLKDFVKEFQEKMENQSLKLEDFSGSATRSVAKRILNIQSELTTKDPDEAFKHYDDISKWLRKDDLEDPVKSNATEKLISICSDFKAWLDIEYPTYHISTLIRRQFFNISLINNAFNEISHYKKENNKFMISEVPMFLAEISGNNSSSFIYEKIGTYYNNYLIDEFQDTSRTQWDAFSPLIEESLSHHYKNLNILVGDVKQSIYGWRGGDWELLGGQVKKDFPDYYNEINLDTNFRSGKNIVDFNNAFFKIAAQLLQNDFNSDQKSEIKNHLQSKITDCVYNQIEQKSNDEHKKSYLEINIIDNSGRDREGIDKALSIMMHQIEMIQEKGYRAGDIMILVRKNTEGREIADHILSYSKSENAKPGLNYDVISADSLFVTANNSVCFIISLLKYLTDTNNDLARAEAAYNLHRSNNPETTYGTEFNLHKYYQDFDNIVNNVKENLISSSLQEIIDKVIYIFGLNNNSGNIPFLTSFRDIVHDFGLNNSSGIHGFLEWWEEAGDKQTLKIPERQNAINIITGHKAKGLAAEFVLIPFCNWELMKSSGIIWCEIDKKPFDVLPFWPLNFSKRLNIGYTSRYYEKERFNRVIEAFNLMYVAFTRAKKALFITSISKESKDGLKNTGQLLVSSINSSDIIQDQNFIINETGEKDIIQYYKGEIENTNSEYPDNRYFEKYPVFIPTKKPVIRSFAAQAGEVPKSMELMKRGIIYHELFEKTINTETLKPALNELVNKGVIRKSEQNELFKNVTDLLENKYVKNWFDGTYNVFNERDIFCGKGKIRRPDRIMEKDNELIVLDYKFGEKETQHNIDQVFDYGEILKSMGYEKVEKYIWYVFLRKLVKVIDRENVVISDI